MNQNQKGFSSNVIIILIVLVAIGIGFYFWQQSQLLAIDETADWKIYKNLELGYEIKYPPEWFLKEEPFRSTCLNTSFCGNDNPNCGISCIDSISIQNLEEKVVLAGGGPFTENGSSFNLQILEIPNSYIEEWLKGYSEIMKIAGTERQVDLGMDSEFSGGIRFINNNKRYSFHYASGSSEQLKKDLFTFQQIISTFKFLD